MGESENDRVGTVIVDDAARCIAAMTHEDRMPRYITNGLDSCENVTFSPELKRRALALITSE